MARKTRKEKILEIISNRHMYSCMNNTKWNELKAGIAQLPFCPPYIMKTVDGEPPEVPFDEDVWYLGDWGLEIDGCLSSDIYATPFYAIEWIIVRPRYTKHQGRLLPDKLIDETDLFVKLLEQCNIPYHEENGSYVIYGYQI
ncbi:MAG: hypothetical protein LBV33_08185 [Lachnospiraceae bacterium]|jgi:hypothetical protein|nr:hypothetical protein [Lachnospiraceae bacterium]